MNGEDLAEVAAVQINLYRARREKARLNREAKKLRMAAAHQDEVIQVSLQRLRDSVFAILDSLPTASLDDLKAYPDLMNRFETILSQAEMSEREVIDYLNWRMSQRNPKEGG